MSLRASLKRAISVLNGFAGRAVFALAILLVISAMPARTQDSPAPPPPTVSAPGGNPQNPQAPIQPTVPAITTTTGLVHLVVTVTDHHHNFITDLDKSDFKVLENGAPQDIKFFGRETDLPLRIGLLLDTSNSIRPRLEFEKDAAIDFLNKVIRRNKDLAFLMTFDNEPEIIQDYTGDLDLLMTAVRAQRAGGGTALNDAIVMASDKLAHPPLPKGPETEVRRVVVVITDGQDNLSDRATTDAIDASIRSEAAVFAVSTNTDWLAVDDASKPSKYHLEAGDKVLEQFADQTGGHAFFPYRIDDLAQSFLDIGTELRSQYFIAYAPTNPPATGQYRPIDVQTIRKGLIVSTRKGYYGAAPPPVPTGN
jgi:Ca-activated chloride channel family protein